MQDFLTGRSVRKDEAARYAPGPVRPWLPAIVVLAMPARLKRFDEMWDAYPNPGGTADEAKANIGGQASAETIDRRDPDHPRRRRAQLCAAGP